MSTSARPSVLVLPALALLALVTGCEGSSAAAQEAVPSTSAAPVPAPEPDPAGPVDSWVHLRNVSCTFDGATYRIDFTIVWSDGHTARVHTNGSEPELQFFNITWPYAGQDLWTVFPEDQVQYC